MALLFLDSFGTYSAVGELNNKWTTITGPVVTLTTGQFGAPALRFTSSVTTQVLFKQLAANSMKRVGFWISGNFVSPTAANPFVVRSSASGANNTGSWMNIWGNGTITFLDGGAAALQVGILAAGTLKPSTQYWIELEIKTTGLKCFIDGLQVFNYTGGITNTRDIALSCIQPSLSNGDTYTVSHLVVWDDTGTTFNSYPMGPQRTQAIRPTAAGAVADWTPSSGANWQAVDSAGWSGGVGVSTLVTAKDDKHNCADLAWNSYKVNSVVVSIRAVDLNTGGSAVAPLLQDASGTAVGSYVSLPMTNPTILSQNFDKDSSGGDWSKTKIDAMQIGYRSQI